MAFLSLKQLLCIIDRIEEEEIKPLCCKKKACECKIKKPHDCCICKNQKKEVY